MEEQTLLASQATMKTATVEVKVMKIGNRQVTLAVYRQLPLKPVIDPETGELRGISWGRVNYHVDCEGSHLHIVWQQGNELRRAIAERNHLQSDTWKRARHRLDDYEYCYLIARILEGWMPSSDKPELPHMFTFHLEGEDVSLYLGEYSVRNAWSKGENGTFYVSDWVRGQLQEIIRKQGLGCDSNSLLREYLLPTRQKLNEHKKQWQQSYAQLEQLDQLFIAV